MFDLSKVTSVYSGRKGCACGCRGKYSYASEHADRRPSYLDGREWINDQSVKVITTKIDRMLRADDPNIDQVMLDVDGDWLAVDMKNDRTYTLYFV